MSKFNKFLATAAAVLLTLSMLFSTDFHSVTAHAAEGYAYILLDSYAKTLKIGEEAFLIAITSTGKKPSFSSSDSTVASVNTYGKITAKKAGTAMITAKIKNGEASCRVTVQKTIIKLSAAKLSLENGESARLTASSSTGHPVTFKSSKSSVASVDANGVILAKKPGTATITASADKTSAACIVTVKQPVIKLSRSAVSLFRTETVRLAVSSTSKSAPKWKTNKKSVAIVDAKGTVTAVKNGRAIITVTIDGVSRTCEITVKKPVVAFAKENVTLSVGETHAAKAYVSSKNKPAYSSSNSKVAAVDQNGTIRAKAVGKAYIYAKEDGAKGRMTVLVTAD